MSNKFNMDFFKAERLGQKSPPDSVISGKFKDTSVIFDEAESRVDTIPTEKLTAFAGHPPVRDTPKLQELAESIEAHGVLTPLQVRVHSERKGYYEILAGHHRKAAGDRNGVEEYPCIIKNVDDDTAALIVAESNKQNGFDDMLPSEIMWALSIEYEALKHQGKTMQIFQDIEKLENESTCCPMDNKLKSEETVSEKNNISATSLHRYLRLKKLNAELLQMVDNGVLRKQKLLEQTAPTIALRAAGSLSYINEEEQSRLAELLNSGHCVDMKKAEKLKAYSEEGNLNEDTFLLILSGAVFDQKPKVKNKISISTKKVKEYFPADLDGKGYENYIIDALRFYRENHSEEM